MSFMSTINKHSGSYLGSIGRPAGIGAGVAAGIHFGVPMAYEFLTDSQIEIHPALSIGLGTIVAVGVEIAFDMWGQSAAWDTDSLVSSIKTMDELSRNDEKYATELLSALKEQKLDGAWVAVTATMFPAKAPSGAEIQKIVAETVATAVAEELRAMRHCRELDAARAGAGLVQDEDYEYQGFYECIDAEVEAMRQKMHRAPDMFLFRCAMPGPPEPCLCVTSYETVCD